MKDVEQPYKCKYCDIPEDEKPDMIRSRLTECQTELKNFQEIIRYVIPTSGEIPSLPGIDMYGRSIPINGLVGGDHIIYVDFNRRYDLDRHISEAESQGRKSVAEKLRLCKNKAGMLLADVSGHKITDSVLAAMLHQAFLLGVQYELKNNGEISTDLFENINTRFFHSSSQFKYITMIYGEISQLGHFRFLSAAHPPPIVFSREFNRIVSIGAERMVHFPPIGSMPSAGNWEARNLTRKSPLKKERYSVLEIHLMGQGDILVLFSDGLSEHVNDQEDYYFPRRLEEVLKRSADGRAEEIFEMVRQDMVDFGPLQDDTSFIVIKKQF